MFVSVIAVETEKDGLASQGSITGQMINLEKQGRMPRMAGFAAAIEELGRMRIRRDNLPLLPACTCEGEELCRVHGVLERYRTDRAARRAIEAGTITLQAFEGWRKKHYPKKKNIWTRM